MDGAKIKGTASGFLGLMEDPSGPSQWPLSVEEFVRGGHLQLSDVVLSRHPSALSWLIRHATKGNFSHAAMVMLTPRWQLGWQSTYLIESVFSGVEITDLIDYFSYKGLSVAVKRLNTPWFAEPVRRRVRGRMLDDIKAKYNFPLMLAMAEGLWWSLESRVRGHKRAVIHREEAGMRSPPNEFICSGFVQRGFAEGICEFIQDGRLPAEALKRVIFDRDLATLLPDDWAPFTIDERKRIVAEFVDEFRDSLLGTTPKDIEVSEKFEWVYVLTGGEVYPVSTYKEVCDLLKITPFPG